jgi:hypothetical protein
LVSSKGAPPAIDPVTPRADGSGFPGKVVRPGELPLDQAAEGYKAMDERRAIKALVRQ